MNKIEKDNLIEEVISGYVDILFLEKKIKYKKNNNIKLSKEEQIFDLYLLPPSFLLRHLRGIKK